MKNAMKKTKKPAMKRIILLALMACTPFVLTTAHAETTTETKPIAMETSQLEALGIKSGSIEAVNNAWETPYPAKVVVPNSQLRVVGAPLSGLLESLLVAEGESVTKGQTLAVIHSPQLLEQQSTYLEALTDLNLASTERKRDEELSKEGLIAKRRFLEASAKYTQAKMRVEQYRQALKLSGIDDEAIAALKRTRKLSPSLNVKAPLSGIVLEQLATPGGQLNALEPIYKVGHLEPLWLEVHVPLDQLGTIAKGTEVRAIQPEVTGKVITVGRMVHGTDQGVLIRAEIKEGAAQLRPGQFVQAQLADTSSANTQTFRIPRSALVRNEGQTWVFTAQDKGFLPVAIEIVKEEASSLVISGKLTGNESVVVTGTAALKAAWIEGAE